VQQRLVLATRNKGKLVEFRRILDALAPGEINLVVVDEFADVVGVEETGSTFKENALLKARYAASATGLPAISDDSGLCVDFLNGDPGIYSARWAGTHGNDQANLEKLLLELKDVEDDKRSAHFTCVAALAMPDGRNHVEEGLFHGHILHAPVGQEGFGYDPIFQPLGMSISSAQMSPKEKDAISHRGKALRLIAPHVIQMLRGLG
jgi:XTP/dITP diphosphohydrolase